MASRGFDELEARLKALGVGGAILRQFQIETIADAKIHVRRKTGDLGRAIVPGQISETHASVEARKPYAAPIEFGAKPHIIRAKNARALAWGGSRRLSGRLRTGAKPTHFAKSVHHPGSRPYPYLVPAAKKAASKIKGAIVQAWNDAA